VTEAVEGAAAPTDDQGRRRVAIACQGGGSHTAFTAGVLSRLLDGLDRYEIVGLSGTSGGAACALLAWTALVDREPQKARALLDGFWTDNSAATPLDAVTNAGVLWASTLQGAGVLPVVSPYDVPVNGLDRLRELLERRVDFDRIRVDADARQPLLLVGAVDVLSGAFQTFNSRRERITADAILASAAIPSLFPAVHIDGRTYWDGLFSQNPPVRELLDTRPDELWVIQINPTARTEEPRTVLDIADRRNELAGNLSLYQELNVIELIDRLLAGGMLVGDRYKQVVVRVLELARSASSRLLGPASKLNRDPGFIHNLMAQGEQQAEEFLAVLAFERAWRRQDLDAVLQILAPEAELVATAPFPEARRAPGAQVREAVAALCRDVRMDLTRKQLNREHASWTVRFRGGAPDQLGRITATLTDGRITGLTLGPAPG
jgi:NTE family protein